MRDRTCTDARAAYIILNGNGLHRISRRGSTVRVLFILMHSGSQRNLETLWDRYVSGIL